MGSQQLSSERPLFVIHEGKVHGRNIDSVGCVPNKKPIWRTPVTTLSRLSESSVFIMAFEKWEVRDSIRVFHQVMSVILLVVSVLMNVLLLLMLTRKRLRHRRTARSFICLVQNLAIANILVVLLGVPLDRVWHGPARYPFGAVGCKTIEPLRSTAFQAMIHMFVAVIVQRWYGIVHSLYGQLKFFHAVFICLAVWIVALCTSIPFVVTLQYLDSTSCFMEWNVSGRAYMVVLFVVQYLLPVLVMIALCISIKSRLKK